MDAETRAQQEWQKAWEQVARLGWCVGRSRVPGEEAIVLVRDHTVAVPARWQGCDTYTLAELTAKLTRLEARERWLNNIG